MHHSLIYPMQKVRGRTNVLLGYMLSGTWTEHFNGFGGKVEKETPAACAIRELKEESGIEIELNQLDHKGWVLFIEKGQSKDQGILIDVFTAKLDGRKTYIPEMTEDALPCWFDAEALPMTRMPEFDKYWIEMIFTKQWRWSEYTITTENGEVINVTGSNRIANSRI